MKKWFKIKTNQRSNQIKNEINYNKNVLIVNRNNKKMGVGKENCKNERERENRRKHTKNIN